jgi:hypothetical protein
VVFIGGPASVKTAAFLSETAGDMRGAIRDNAPDQLEKIKAERLSTVGVGEDLSETFSGKPTLAIIGRPWLFRMLLAKSFLLSLLIKGRFLKSFFRKKAAWFD